MKKLLIILIFSFLPFDFASAISDLPPCKGENYKKYVNCYGSYKGKDFSEIYNIPGLTFNYVGEFGDLPGLANGHGIADEYVNGEYEGTYIGNFKNDKFDGLVTFIGQDYFSVVEYKLDEPINGTAFLIEDKYLYVGEYNKDEELHGLGAVIRPDGWTYNFWKNNEIVENNEEQSAINIINYSPCKGNDPSKWDYCTVYKEFFYYDDQRYDIYSGALNIYSSASDSFSYPPKTKLPKYNGKGIVESYFDGKLSHIYIGEFKKDLRSGYGTYYDVVDNSVFVGQFKNNNLDGYGTYIRKDEKYVGYFFEGYYHGWGVLFTKGKRNISAFMHGNFLHEIENNVKIDKDVFLGCKSNILNGIPVREFDLKVILDKNLNRLIVSSNLTSDGKPSYYSNFIVEEILLNSDEYLIGFYRDDKYDQNFHFMLDKFSGKFIVTEISDISNKYLIKTTGLSTLTAKCQNKLF